MARGETPRTFGGPIDYELCDWAEDGHRCILAAGHLRMRSPSGPHAPWPPVRAKKPDRTPDQSGLVAHAPDVAS
jgi:hypothetical protein